MAIRAIDAMAGARAPAGSALQEPAAWEQLGKAGVSCGQLPTHPTVGKVFSLPQGPTLLSLPHPFAHTHTEASVWIPKQDQIIKQPESSADWSPLWENTRKSTINTN